MTTEIDTALSAELDAVEQEVARLDTPEKRFSQLSKNFVSAIAIISAMQENRDWETLKKEDGSDYRSLTELVQDALQVSDSYARRLVQTADNFYMPLEAVTVQGTVISITANQAAQLGTGGMNEVVQRAADEFSDDDDPADQSARISDITKDVLSEKKSANVPSISDFDDDFSDDDFTSIDDELGDFDDFDDDLESEMSSGIDVGKMSAADGSSPQPKMQSKKKDAKAPNVGGKEESKPESKDFLKPIEKVMSGGKEYVTDEAIEELPEELQEFVRAVNYLTSIDAQKISDMITQERRGATYSIRKASSQLTLVLSSTEMSNWVLEQI